MHSDACHTEFSASQADDVYVVQGPPFAYALNAFCSDDFSTSTPQIVHGVAKADSAVGLLCQQLAADRVVRVTHLAGV